MKADDNHESTQYHKFDTGKAFPVTMVKIFMLCDIIFICN